MNSRLTLLSAICLASGMTTPAMAQPLDPGSLDESDFRPKKLMRPLRAIVNAPFIAATDVKNEVNDNELVIGLVVGKQARAYPVNMLTGPSREIINDTVGGQHIAATW